jgi:aminoglycoside phosphotransferase
VATVPAAIRAVLPEPAWQQVWVKRGTEVWRVETAAGVRFAKVASGGERAELRAEAERLEWAAAAHLPVPVPEVLASADDDGDALAPAGEAPAPAGDHDGRTWLVTGALDGVPASDPAWRQRGLEAMVEAVGDALRRLHDADPATCPFRLGVDELVASAVGRVAAGGVDPSTMAAESYRRRSADDLLAHLQATRPTEPEADRVVAHGDAVLPNVLLRPADAGLAGWVDVGRLGVSDRHRDLALVARSLAMNAGPELVWRLFDAYGMPHPDPLRLEWYALVDDMW